MPRLRALPILIAFMMVFLAGVFLAGDACAGSPGPGDQTTEQEAATMSIRVTSSAFAEGQPIPATFTCDGQDQSPPLEWEGIPAGTGSIAIVVDDPDAPGKTFTHWVLYDLPGGTTSVQQGTPPRQERLSNGALQGKNDFGRVGYGGPCPPRGPAHRYQFHVYALGQKLGIEPGATRTQLGRAMDGKVLGQGRLTGTYQRR